MNQFKRAIMWIVLLLILLLILFSIYGAFIGVNRAPAFFNSIPLVVYWVSFIVLLAIGIITFKRLLRVPGLLLIHLGCIAILIGAIWGSEGGHGIQKKFFNRDNIRAGKMVIYEGMSENRVLREDADVAFGLDHDGKLVFFEAHDEQHAIIKDDDKRIFSLPFRLKLIDFRMDYYDSPSLMVKSADGKEYMLDPVEAGRGFRLADNTVITILEIYKNLKLKMKEGGGFEAYDSKEPGSNPAVKTVVEYPDGTKEQQFAFAGFSGDMGRKRRLSMRLRNMGMVRDYFSDIQVIEEGKVILEKAIEVNAPLHYGGYHFYQSSYDEREERYTVLSVMSDSGLYIVYAGLWVMGIGIMWVLWLRPVIRHIKKAGATGGDTHGV